MRTLLILLAAGLPLACGQVTASAQSAGTSLTAQTRAAPKRLAANRAVSKRPVKRRYRRGYGPYGFLPGYRPPEVIAWEEEMKARRRPFYALPWARFHRGRWNGGGFGPCYTYTPIGPVWNCGQ